MNRKLSDYTIARELGEQVCQRITRSTIESLQAMGDTIAPEEGGGLESVWEEFCVEVQHPNGRRLVTWREDGHNAEWVRVLVEGYVTRLEPFEKDAVWMLTLKGDDWECEDEGERASYPVCDYDIVRHITERYVYPKAGSWSSERVEAFLHRWW